MDSAVRSKQTKEQKMKVVIKATQDTINAANSLFIERHESFYAFNYKETRNAKVAALFGYDEDTDAVRCGYQQNGLRSGWVTCGGNAVLLAPYRETITYLGTRHGVSPLLEALGLNRRSELDKCEVVTYETSMKFLRVGETLQHFFERAALNAECDIERGIAALKSGKPPAFLYAQGLDVNKIVSLYKECENHGYCAGL